MYAIFPLLSLQKKRRNVSKFTVPGANSLWELRPFDDVIKLLLHQKNARNALFIDLDGAEWHEGGLFESFHSDAMCQIFAENFRQIVLLIRCNFRLFEYLKFFNSHLHSHRFWLAEDSQNYRKLFLWIYLFEKRCHFQRIAATFDGSMQTIVFIANKIWPLFNDSNSH